MLVGVGRGGRLIHIGDIQMVVSHWSELLVGIWSNEGLGTSANNVDHQMISFGNNSSVSIGWEYGNCTTIEGLPCSGDPCVMLWDDVAQGEMMLVATCGRNDLVTVSRCLSDIVSAGVRLSKTEEQILNALATFVRAVCVVEIDREAL